MHILTVHHDAVPKQLKLCVTYRNQNRRGGRAWREVWSAMARRCPRTPCCKA